MAGRASHSDSRVNVLLRKHGLVVAGVADVGLSSGEELWAIRGMRIVAGRASHADCRVNVLLRKHGLVMAAVAEIGLARGEELWAIR